MNNVTLHYLKQARKHTHLSLQDMSYLLDMDISNLSKYERGKKYAPLLVVLSYHTLSKIPLKRLFRNELDDLSFSIQTRIIGLLEKLETAPPDPKLEQRKKALKNLISQVDDDSAPCNLPL